jgi:hypothetical protein
MIHDYGTFPLIQNLITLNRPYISKKFCTITMFAVGYIQKYVFVVLKRIFGP